VAPMSCRAFSTNPPSSIVPSEQVQLLLKSVGMVQGRPLNNKQSLVHACHIEVLSASISQLSQIRILPLH
jgi:hypothetical protein